METRETRKKPQFASPRLQPAGPTRPGNDIEMQPPAAPIPTGEEVPRKPSPTPLQESLRRLWRDKRAVTSLFILAFLILFAIIFPPIYQHIGGDYNSDVNGQVKPTDYHSYGFIEPTQKSKGPSAMYWLGTDHTGRDLLARLMQGLQISVLVAVLVEVVDVLLGVTIGLLAGYYGGWIDQFLARFTDLMFAFPGLLFVILLTGIFGSAADVALRNVPILGQQGNAKLVLVSLALSLTVWPLMARYVRGQTLQIKQQQYIEAARTAGTSDFKILTGHVLPNLFNIVILASTLNMVNTIIAESGISLLGLGVQPPGSSLGLMISDGSTYLQTSPWEALLPSFVLALIVLSFSFLGDGIRDAFDPRTKD